MPFFKYVGQSKNQELISGWIEAANLRIAAKILTVAGGLRVLEIKPASFLVANFRKRFKQVKDDDIYLMTRSFAALISSGIPIFESLKILFKNEENDALKGVLISVLYDIRNGSTISWAMSKHPKIFSPVYLGMIKAGETTGALDLMLRRLSNFLEREFRTRRMIKAALVYPAFIFLFCLGAAFLTFYYILPALLGSVINASASLPLPTRILYFLVKTGHNPYFQLAFISGLFSYWIFLKKRLEKPENKLKLDKLKLNLPVFGPLYKKFLTAQFFRSFGLCLSSGVPILKTLSTIQEYSDNTYFTKFVLSPFIEEIRNGHGIAAALIKKLDFFELMAVHMVDVGDQVGKAPLMLSKIAGIYDEEIAYSLDTFIVLLEPFLITAMGLLVGFIILAIFMPLYQFITKVV